MAWAVLDGAERWCWSLLAAMGGSATAEVAGVGETRRIRRLRPSKRPCGAPDKKKEQGARRQRAHW